MKQRNRNKNTTKQDIILKEQPPTSPNNANPGRSYGARRRRRGVDQEQEELEEENTTAEPMGEEPRHSPDGSVGQNLGAHQQRWRRARQNPL